MDEFLMRAAYVAAICAVTLIGVLIKRVYKSIDLLFGKLDRQAKEIHRLQMAICAVAPDKTSMFTAFMVKDDAANN
jgi:hypothetical protein